MRSFFGKWIGKEGAEGPVVSADEAKLSFLAMRWDNNLAQQFFAQVNTTAVNDSFMAFLAQMSSLASDDLVSLTAEVKLLRHYLELYTAVQESEFHYKLEEKIEDDVMIPALLLFPLVKNAVQYGYTSMHERPLRIKISCIGNRLSLEVSNRVNHHLVSQADTELIAQFKKRLQYGYADQYNLFSNSNSATFKVNFQFNIR